MAPRAQWKGYLRLSLVSCPIALYPASSSSEKIRFNQINKKTGNRIRMMKVDAETGDQVENDDIIKGYKVDADRYVEITPEELEAVQIESTRTVDIEQFVQRSEIDDLYIADPYYVVPDGKVGAQAFAVIREAINKKGMVALGRVVFSTREHVIGLEPRGKGLFGFTLRYPYEIRKDKDYFDGIPDEKLPKEMIDLATHIIEQKAGHFKPQAFDDRYETALQDIIRKKVAGQPITPAKRRDPGNVVNLMDALRQSIQTDRGSGAKRPPAPSSDRSRKKPPARSTARRKRAI
jgi:DNA end-binding protein Ku